MGGLHNFPESFSFTRNGQLNVIMNNMLYIGDDLIPMTSGEGEILTGVWYSDSNVSNIIFVLDMKTRPTNKWVFTFYSNNQVKFYGYYQNYHHQQI